MKMRVMRLLIAVSVLGSSIVSDVCALKDLNPAGYVEDLSTLPGSEIYQQHTMQQPYSMSTRIEQDPLLCVVGLTVAGFIIMYALNSEFRNKVHVWLGLHSDEEDSVKL